MKIKIWLFSLFVSLLGIVPAFVFAASGSSGACPGGSSTMNQLNSTLGGLDVFPKYCTASALVLYVIGLIFGLIGIVALLMIIYAGFQYVAAGVNEDLAKKAKKTLMYAVIGLAISIFAYSAITITINLIGQGAGGASTTSSGSGPGGSGPGSGSGSAQACPSNADVALNITDPSGNAISSINAGGTFDVTPQIQESMSNCSNYTVAIKAADESGGNPVSICPPTLADNTKCVVDTSKDIAFQAGHSYSISALYTDSQGNTVGSSVSRAQLFINSSGNGNKGSGGGQTSLVCPSGDNVSLSISPATAYSPGTLSIVPKLENTDSGSSLSACAGGYTIQIEAEAAEHGASQSPSLCSATLQDGQTCNITLGAQSYFQPGLTYFLMATYVASDGSTIGASSGQDTVLVEPASSSGSHSGASGG